MRFRLTKFLFGVGLCARLNGQAIDLVDPFAHHDDAKMAMARNPIATPHLVRAMQLRPELGVGPEYSFQVVSAETDDLGGVHVRLREYYQGVRVRKGMIISHADANGNFDSYTDSLKRKIDIGVQPAISVESAVAAVSRSPMHTSPYSWTPKTELVIDPIQERVYVQTGLPVTRKDTVISNNPLALPPDVNATDTTLRVKQYRLAYEIRTIEGQEKGGTAAAWIHYVDANTGQILEQLPLSHTATGTGKGQFSGLVNFKTNCGGTGCRMLDLDRHFYVEDDDRSTSDPVNTDFSGGWGDGQPFQGDASASNTNRQTAMVDGIYGSMVYWNMMSDIFHRKGPDNNFYDVNVFVHYGTNWNNACYFVLTGNIHVGDGKAMQRLEVLAHENGHALNDFTAGLYYGEGEGLDESNSDIWGAMSTFYEPVGRPAVNNPPVASIPDTGGVWFLQGANRSLQQPSSQGQSDYWYPNLWEADEHDIAAPNNRAFYFLSQGASAYMDNAGYTPLMPWGSTGVGNARASRIWYDALVHYMTDDTDYLAAEAACLVAAQKRYGSASPEVLAVLNAYAGINVGTKAPNYPGPVVPHAESSNNLTSQTAEFIPHTMQSVVSPLPNKTKITGGGSSSRWFRVNLHGGESFTTRLAGGGGSNYDLFIWAPTLLGKSEQGTGSADLLRVDVTIDPSLSADFFIQVFPKQATSTSQFVLDFDFFHH